MPKIRIVLTSLLVFAALLSGCSSHPTLQGSTSAPAMDDLANASRVKATLYAQYDEWKAVKYKSGGLSKNGVDCSGFVYLTYDERFDIKLPRSTDEQINIGPEVPQNKLVPGDLVFFKTGKADKTGKSQRHVGIYIEDRKFMHASTEKGVMISSLDDQYWSRTYWKSIRVNVSNLPVTLR